jgi:hypothetical protein
MKFLKRLVIFVGSLGLFVSCATHQYDYSDNNYAGSMAKINTSWQVTGIVERFITTPEGEVDGLILENGMQVRFPSHMSTAITDAITVGDSITVKGYESPTDAMWAQKIITLKNANEINIAERAKGKLLASRSEALRKRKPIDNLSVSGEIDTLLHEPSGEVSGFLLNDGSVVRLPLDIRAPSQSYDIGQYVEVTGYGTDNNFGRSIEAATVQRQSTIYEIDYE